MPTDYRQNDTLLRHAIDKLYKENDKMKVSPDFADRLRQRIHQEETKRHTRLMRRRIGFAIGIAAAVALIMYISISLFTKELQSDSKSLITRLPTTDEPEEHKEKVDTVKREQEDTVHHVKELPPVPRLPKRYMASQVKKEKDLDEPVTYDESADYDAAERYLEAPPTQSITSLIEVDYEDLKREIEERGRKIKENIELAINQNDEEE